MASKPADHTNSNTARDSIRENRYESISKPNDQTRDPNEILEEEVALRENPVAEPELSDTSDEEPPSAPSATAENSEDGDEIGDEELLEMLEQLSETIDSAHNVLAEQQVHSPEVKPAEPHIALEEQAHGLEEQFYGLQEQAGDLEEQTSVLDFPLTPPLPGTPATKSFIVPFLATIFGVIFGIAALAALWLFWNSPGNPGDIDLAKGQDRFSGTAVSRPVKSEERAPSQASIPAKTAEPLQPSTSINPAPAPAPVAQAVQTPEPATPSPEPVTKPITAPPAQPAIVEPPVKVVKKALVPPAESAPPTAPAAPAIEISKDAPQTPAKTASLPEPATEPVKEQPVIAPVGIEKTPALPSIGKAEEVVFLKRGRDLVDSGDVASARLAYEYAALRGSADAMFALAQTYDPEMLSSWNVFGIEPDAKIALEWYGRAAQEGHDGADARANELEKLSKR